MAIDNVNTIVERRSIIVKNRVLKTPLLVFFDPRLLIVKGVFNYRLSGVVKE